jgi:cytochrome c-type biogenesis protein CcmH
MIFWSLAGLLTALTVLVLLRPLVHSGRLKTMLVIAVPMAAIGLYILLGRPELSDKSSKPQLPPVLAGTVAKLEAATKADPGDGFSWQLLGEVYTRLERGKQAVNAYRQALKAAPDNPDLRLALATELVQEADGKVTPEAQGMFRQMPDEAVSRYYLAEAAAQDGDWETAQEHWRGLAEETPPDSPLAAKLASRLGEAKQALGQD